MSYVRLDRIQVYLAWWLDGSRCDHDIVCVVCVFVGWTKKRHFFLLTHNVSSDADKIMPHVIALDNIFILIDHLNISNDSFIDYLLQCNANCPIWLIHSYIVYNTQNIQNRFQIEKKNVIAASAMQWKTKKTKQNSPFHIFHCNSLCIMQWNKH